MAYAHSRLRLAIENAGIEINMGLALWTYFSPVDSIATVTAAGYFSPLPKNMQVGDLVNVYDVNAATVTICQVTNVNPYTASFNGSATITALSGGSSSSNIVPTRLVAGGASDTATAADGFIGWNSATASAKSEVLPAPTTKGQEITVKDVYGNAATYNITVTTAAGTIDSGASVVMNVNKQSLNFTADGVSNWMVS